VLTDDSAQKGLESRSLMVMDMGQHVVQDYAQPLTLHQILVPGWKIGLAPFPAFPLPSSYPQVS